MKVELAATGARSSGAEEWIDMLAGGQMFLELLHFSSFQV
jgi:hypothetical protein